MAIENQEYGVGIPVVNVQQVDYQVISGDECTSANVTCFRWQNQSLGIQGYFVEGVRQLPGQEQSILNVRGFCDDLGFSGETSAKCQDQFGSFNGPNFDSEGIYTGMGSHVNNLANASLVGGYELNFPAQPCAEGMCVNIGGKSVTLEQLHIAIESNTTDITDSHDGGQPMVSPCGSVFIAPFVLGAVIFRALKNNKT